MAGRRLTEALKEADNCVEKMRPAVLETSTATMEKVLAAFREIQLAEEDFAAATGYGYGDRAREKLEQLYSLTFDAEAAIVRPQIISGTHALAITLFGLLRPGDGLLAVTGAPYDTLQQVIGSAGRAKGSLKEWGIGYEEIDLLSARGREEDLLSRTVTWPKLVLIQRSRGYSQRPSLTVADINRLTSVIKRRFPGAIILVDNCYGEFVQDKEPLCAGAHIIAGSLIKNPGGGIAPGGGYIAGKNDLIEMVAERATAPGLGMEVGPNLGLARGFFQGFFAAPHAVAEALLGAVFAAALFTSLGYKVSPPWEEARGDIIQEIQLGRPDRLQAFCREIQRYSPVGSHVIPEPAPMAGYDDHIIMAAGGFTQGGSLELSADAPLRLPYSVFLQGGVALQQSRLALAAAAAAVLKLAE